MSRHAPSPHFDVSRNIVPGGQVEFAGNDVPRVVALIVAISQGTYAFAPVVFGMIREFAPHSAGAGSGSAPALFATAGIVQGLAIAAFLAGRRSA